VIHRTGRIVGRFFTRYDILLSPTMCQPPYPLGVLDMMTDDSERYTRAILGAIGFTSLFNQAGTPAMSVPLGWSRGGLPIGVQFAAPYGDEATLFRLGAQLEAAEPWAARRPPVAPSRRQP
jgi:Asp-tRNA(Asn)/Glu-tRNA(Gln) amidotransferase A subunit family amidase